MAGDYILENNHGERVRETERGKNNPLIVPEQYKGLSLKSDNQRVVIQPQIDSVTLARNSGITLLLLSSSFFKFVYYLGFHFVVFLLLFLFFCCCCLFVLVNIVILQHNC